MNDDQLKDLLQKHRPLPPPADDQQLNFLLNRLNLKSRSAQSAPIWLAFATGTAACLFAYLTLFPYFQTDSVAPAQEIALRSPPEELSSEEDEFFAELPTLGVGEDYLMLASSSQNTGR